MMAFRWLGSRPRCGSSHLGGLSKLVLFLYLEFDGCWSGASRTPYRGVGKVLMLRSRLWFCSLVAAVLEFGICAACRSVKRKLGDGADAAIKQLNTSSSVTVRCP
ncbi:hypothetical protein Droror1_Dr00023281 [Drosera rotundifolia]